MPGTGGATGALQCGGLGDPADIDHGAYPTRHLQVLGAHPDLTDSVSERPGLADDQTHDPHGQFGRAVVAVLGDSHGHILVRVAAARETAPCRRWGAQAPPSSHAGVVFLDRHRPLYHGDDQPARWRAPRQEVKP